MSTARRELGLEEIQAIIPHRPPFLFIDRVLELEPGRSGKAVKAVGANEPYFLGHFPGRPILPGVLIIEALAQTIAVVMGSPADHLHCSPGEPKVGYLIKADMKFLRIVRPGDSLTLEVRLITRADSFVQMHCRALLASGPAAEGRISVAL